MPFPVDSLPQTPDLGTFLNYYNSGYGSQTMSEEMFNHWGGNDLLEAIRKYDPNAQWTQGQMGGENGGNGYRLDFDLNKMPTPAGFKDWGEGINARSSSFGDMINKNMVKNDPHYGSITHVKNIKKPSDKWWTYAAPLAVGIGGPMLGGYLASLGIGGAGLTSAATGSGLTGSAPKWLANTLKGLPKSVGSMAKNGFNPMQLAGLAGGMIPGMQNVGQMLQYYKMASMAKNLMKGR